MTMMDTDEGKTVMCLLTDPEGTHLGSAMYIPQKAGPLQLTQLVNRFLDNVIISSLFFLTLKFV